MAIPRADIQLASRHQSQDRKDRSAAWGEYGIPLRIRNSAQPLFFAPFLIDGRPALSREYGAKLTLIEEGWRAPCSLSISISVSPIKEISVLRFGLIPLMFRWAISTPSFLTFIIISLRLRPLVPIPSIRLSPCASPNSVSALIAL